MRPYIDCTLGFEERTCCLLEENPCTQSTQQEKPFVTAKETTPWTGPWGRLRIPKIIPEVTASSPARSDWAGSSGWFALQPLFLLEPGPTPLKD